MKVTEINDGNIEELVSASGKAVVDCYAPWCGPCKMLSPVIDELADEMEDVSFYKLNVDDNDSAAEKYDVMSIPTILVFENGALKNKLVGYKTKDELKANF